LNEKKRTIKILLGLLIFVGAACICFVVLFSVNENKTVVAMKDFENIQEKHEKATN